MANVVVRFPPSPTGYIHVGNVRTALINWLFARQHGGTFILRMDDTDTERSRPEFETAIQEDLRWLGLTWDGPLVRQQDRFDRYEEAKQKLLASGRLYPCYETEEELEIKRKMQASRGLPPIYDRGALKLTETQKSDYESQGRQPHYRFLLDHRDIKWEDLIRGASHYHGSNISDPVLVRADGIPLYTLASVVDDGEMGITHILRGEDHVTNTAVQIQIFEALGFPIPTFGHNALLVMKDGKLSKRKGDAASIRTMREAGEIEPMALNSYLARIGTSDPVEPFLDLQALVKQFDLSKFGRAPANFDFLPLEALNARILHMRTFAEIKPRLDALGLMQIDEPFWNAVSVNLTRLGDLKDWWEICKGTITPTITDKEYTTQAATLLPNPLNDGSFDAWKQAVQSATGKKGKDLFMPLRLAITGREDGPDLRMVLQHTARQKIIDRLQGITA